MAAESDNPYAAPAVESQVRQTHEIRKDLSRVSARWIVACCCCYSVVVALLSSMVLNSISPGYTAVWLMSVPIALLAVVLGTRYRIRSIWVVLALSGMVSWIVIFLVAWGLYENDLITASVRRTDVPIFAGVGIGTAVVSNLIAALCGWLRTSQKSPR